MALTTAPVELVSLDGTVTINDSSADVDFRVESNGDQHAIFVNAGDDRVTFFNSTTVNAASGTADGASHYSDGRTDISKSGGQPLNLRRRTDGGIITGYFSESSGSVTNVANFSVTTGGDFSLNTPNGNFIINEDSNDSDFRVESNGNTHMLFVDAGNDRVLVGKSSTGLANQGVEFEGGQIKGTATGQTVAFLNRASDDGTILDIRKDNSTVGSIGSISSDLYIAESNSGLRFDGENNQILPSSTTASTDGTCNLGAGSARFKDLYLSGGVFVGGTGSANELDDYEEGTFTPVVSGASTAGVFAYTLQQGSYTKVGRLVSFFITIYVTSTSTSPVGSVTLTGLPFTAQNTNNAQYAGSMGWLQNIGIGETIGVYVGGSSSTVILRNLTSGGAGGLVQGGDLGNDFYIVVGGQYHV